MRDRNSPHSAEAIMWMSRALLAGAGVLAGTLALHAQPPSRPSPPPPGTVTLTLSDYDRLLARAERPLVRPEPPPIPAVLARADLQVRVSADRVRGTFTLDGEVFKTGVVAVPLVAGATLIEARLERGVLPLTHDGTTNLALVEGPRSFSIELQWGSALESSPGRASFVLPVPNAGSVTAAIEVPGQPAELRVEPGAIIRSSPAGGSTRIDAALVPGTAARVSWSSRQAAATPGAARELRMLADLKHLVTVGEADVRVTSLVDVTVVRGETDRFDMRVPTGFAVTAASGPALERTEEAPGVVTLMLRTPAQRRHQFVVSFERTVAEVSPLDVPLPSLADAERETGEVAVEAAGTIDLTARETDLLRRIDVREASAPLRSLASQPLLAALRYRRRAPQPPVVSLDVTRFPDAPVIAAVAERAVATSLVTAEGRMLTEVALTLRNRAQPFMRVDLPQGATMVSAEVAGEAVKLAQGPDGTRVPLLRPGLRADGPYVVSFVYIHTGPAFGKKGRGELVLPRMDVPVALVEWEVLLPERYRLKRFDGNAVLVRPDDSGPAGMAAGYDGGPVEQGTGRGFGTGEGRAATRAGREARSGVALEVPGGVRDGHIEGRVLDHAGTPLPGATLRVLRDGTPVAEAVSDASGAYVLEGLGAGRFEITAQLAGFVSGHQTVVLGAGHGSRVEFRLPVTGPTETVTVHAAQKVAEERDELAQAPSENVFNLQRRVSGVLPVRIDVPRAGLAYRFARPLVLDETTEVRFEYRTR